MSILTVYCGPMFAGKSTSLLREYNQETKTKILLKPSMDTRYGFDSITTHDGNKAKAHPIVKMPFISVDSVFLDEIQFMEDPWYSGDILTDINILLNEGKNITASGLDMDAHGIPFSVTSGLLAMADIVVKLKSICDICSLPASMTSLRSPSERVHLGGSELYFPTCRKHHSL